MGFSTTKNVTGRDGYYQELYHKRKKIVTEGNFS